MIIIYFVPVILIVMLLLLGGSIAYWFVQNIAFIAFLFVMSRVMTGIINYAFKSDNRLYLVLALIIAIILLIIIIMYIEHITGPMTALGSSTERTLKFVVFFCIAYFLPIAWYKGYKGYL